MQANPIFFFGLIIGGMVLGKSAAVAQPVAQTNLSVTILPELSALETALQCAQTTGAPILVIAGRKSCPPCRALKHQVKTDELTRQVLRDCVKVYLDCDSSEYQHWIAIHPPIDAVLPQWFLVRADGQELINRTGGVSKEELRTVLTTNLSRAGKTIDESDSDQIEELVAVVNRLLSQDVIAAAEAITKGTSILRIANNNYSAPSNQLRERLRQVQGELVKQIDSARRQLSEIEQLDETMRVERLSELQTLISRLRSIPSVEAPLKRLEADIAGLPDRVETSVQRIP